MFQGSCQASVRVPEGYRKGFGLEVLGLSFEAPTLSSSCQLPCLCIATVSSVLQSQTLELPRIECGLST